MTQVLFQTANAFLTSEDQERYKVKVAFDTCSDYSYVRKAASDKIRFKSHQVTLNIRGYNGRSDGFKVYDVKHAIIESISRPGRRKAVNLVETDRICGPISREAVPPDILHSPYLRGLDLAEDYSCSSEDEIDVLIGLDSYWDLVSSKTRRKKDMPIAVDSILGWMLQANTSAEDLPARCSEPTSLCASVINGTEMHNQLKKFWEIEEIGSHEEVKWTPEENKVHDKFVETLVYEANGEE